MVNLMRQVYFLIVFVMLVACKPKAPENVYTAGEADFSSFTAIGDGHTGGYMDDALYRDGQENSLGTLLQRQLTLVGASDVSVPWMETGNIGVNWNGQARLLLGYKTDCLNNTSLSPLRLSPQGELSSLSTSAYNPSSKFSNFGVPGLRTIDLVSFLLGNLNFVNYNPFFARLSKDQFNFPGSGSFSTYQENVFDGGYPSFCSIYLGIEDVLPFAKSGATSNPMSPVAGLPGIGFEESLGQLCQQLHAQNVKAVIATIPNVSEWPFFNTIPYNGLKLDEDKAASLNQIYNPLGFSFVVGDNPFMIADPNAGMFGVRPALPGEKILLSAPLDSVRCYQMGSVFPFRNEFVLTLDELNEIQTRIDQFNAIIRQKAVAYGFALVEAQNFYNKLPSGFAYNGVTLSAKFVSGGVFSLDGIHLNPRGNALLANEFIKSINHSFKSNIPLINALMFNAVLFP
ncbi:MAG: hypothetical protein FJZ80_07815 [Bacteroidetes bacterium]|nr:hypothetical protein [Bacteroidota bacterium]